MLFFSLLLAQCTAQEWKIVNPQLGLFLSAAAPSRSEPGTWWVPRFEDNVGALGSVSTDAGQTWRDLRNSSSALWMGVSASSTDPSKNAVLAGLGAIKTTLDGEQFEAVKVGIISQYVRSFGDSGFAVVGEQMFPDASGVAISLDKGQNFDFFAIPELKFSSRYGAFTDGAWYVSAGTFPSNSRNSIKPVEYHSINSNVHVHIKTGTVSFVNESTAPVVEAKKADCEGYCGTIAKSTDQGKTWTLVSDVEGHYYNGIGCGNDVNCVVVGEGKDGDVRFAAAWTTRDGGETWAETLRFADSPGVGLMGVHYVSEQEVWIAGGSSSGLMEGRFYHSRDAGQSWQLASSLPGVTVMSLDFAGPGRGLGACLTVFGGADLCVYE